MNDDMVTVEIIIRGQVQQSTNLDIDDYIVKVKNVDDTYYDIFGAHIISMERK